MSYTEHATMTIGADKSQVSSALKQIDKEVANAGKSGAKSMGNSLLVGMKQMRESVGQMGAFLGATMGKEMAGGVSQQLNAILGPAVAGGMMGGGVGMAVGAGLGLVSKVIGDERNRKTLLETTMLTTAEAEAAVSVLGEQSEAASKLVDVYGGLEQAVKKVGEISKLADGERSKASFEFYKQTGLTLSKVRELGDALAEVQRRRSAAPTPATFSNLTGTDFDPSRLRQTEAQENNALDEQIMAARSTAIRGTGTPQSDVLMQSTQGDFQGPFPQKQFIPLDAYQGPQHPDLGALARYNAWNDSRRASADAATNQAVGVLLNWAQRGAVPITPVNGE